MIERSPLSNLDIETVRFSLERRLASTLEAEPGFALHRSARVPRDPSIIRRRLLAQALRLTESMAGDAYRQANTAAEVLGVKGTLELYQSSGRENAALHLVKAPILLEIQGRMLSLLDEEAALALFGHELGHYLAHGPWHELGATALAGVVLAEQGLLSARGTLAAGQLVVAREITADRFGLLAAQDLDAALRLEMAATTGLSGEALGWDTQAYLDQCRELMEETLASGATAQVTTHPEHSLRAWALWLYSETAQYNALTGKGAGERTLVEVDALIERALGSARIELGYDIRDEPPSFLIECALAGAVLVANADGVVAPEELDAIEDAFGGRVPGWSEFLDPEVALERFHETGALVRRAGPDLARSLFLLLSHVMGADDIVDAREVQMLLAIGDALGHRAEFNHWIGAAVEAMGATLEVETLESMAIPLPVRREEIHDAIAALGESVARRGETRIAPRRLLRLAGCTIEDIDARARIEGELANNGVECVPSLTQASLDERVLLRSTRPPEALGVENLEPLDGSRKAIHDALTRLRDELVTGDGRSPSVRLRTLRAPRTFDLFRLDQVRRGAAERALALIMAGKASPLITADDAGRHDAAHACAHDLRQLDRSHRDRREETGANDLYLGYPLVVGNAAPRGATHPGYGIRAPLLLHPVELMRDGRGARGFTLRRRADEDPLANQLLLRVLFNKAELAFPDELSRTLDELAADRAGGMDAVLAKLAEVGLVLRPEGGTLVGFRNRDVDLDERPPFLALEECALVGLFPQSSSDLLQDYDALLQEIADPNTPLKSLLAAGAGLLPDLDESPPEVPQDPPQDASGADALRWPVLPADPSQRAVAEECRNHQITVVDGPPGTGKSQLIVNLVAAALARGERVAVVAEKRAALDVVHQRLEGCELGASTALVHDVTDDRRALYRKIGARLDTFSPRQDDEARRTVLQAEHGQVSERLTARRATLAYRRPGLDLTVGQLLAMKAGDRAPLELPDLAKLEQHPLATVVELCERLHPHRELWSPEGWWRTQEGEHPRASLAKVDDAGLAALRSTVEAAVPPAEALDRELARDPIDRDALKGSGSALDLLHEGREARATPEDARAFVALLAEPDAPVEDTLHLWEQHASALVRFPTPTSMAIDDALYRDVAVLRSFAGRWTRIFSGVWWRARGSVRRALAQVWPEQAASGFSTEFLAQLHDRIAASQAWNASAALGGALALPSSTSRDATEARAHLDRLLVLQAQTRAAQANLAALASLELSLPSSVEDLPAFEEKLALRHGQHQAQLALRAVLQPLDATFPWLAIPSAPTLRALAVHLVHDGHRLREADGWLVQLEACLPSARALLDGLAAADPDASIAEWREAVGRAWADAQLHELRSVLPTLDELGTAADAQRAAADASTLRRLDAELREQEIVRLHATLDRAELLHVPDAAYRARRSPKQKLKERLLKEVGKKRQLWPMRRFVREFAPEGLLEILPCWLLSPETMVVLFAREPLFDLVIFDEASQCTVGSGLPVTLRAHRVVIAGDEQQMPPSSFFRMGGTSTEDEDRSDEERSIRDVFAAESLLALARARCPHVGLRWHYRCREEELIAFSNHAMYEGGLLTIPSTQAAGSTSALRFIDVEDGEYDAGLNRAEARRVVTLLDELLERDPPPTIGVVTFNIRQRETIFEAIDQRVEADEGFARRWQAAMGVDALDARPFVKNLESVQGDERDVIVFSLGHAPVTRTRRGGATERYVPARFGPLGQRGGERRLNVAISRAKQQCYLVSSFEPKLLHVGNSTHGGPRLFKGFLEFAHHLEHGRRAQAQRILDDVRGQAMKPLHAKGPRVLVDGYTPLAAQLALALEERGLRCVLDLGSSDFRVPLAVGHPDDPQRFVVAVMCDEAEDEVSVFERHVHRPAVLELRGWELVALTSADWARRPSDVLAEIEARVRAHA